MLYLAMRQMLARKKQTLLILLGIAFGTMVYVIISGLQLGMRGYISDMLLNNTAHIRISGKENYILKDEVEERIFTSDSLVHWDLPPQGKREDSKLENPYGWFQFLDRIPEVVAYAPRLTINAIITKRKSKWATSVIGIVPEKQRYIGTLDDYIKIGSLASLSGGGNKVIAGSGVMKKLGVDIGQSILISTGTDEPRPFKIVGQVSFGNKDADERLVFANLYDVQTLNKTPGRVSEISVAIDDINKATPLANSWQILGHDKVESWEQANANFMQIIKIQDYTRYVITFSILLVASFGIYNVLSIMIGQKQKEIAILRSIGHGPEKILQLFLYQGLTLGIMGSVLGLVVGFGINKIIESIDLGFEIGKGNHMLISYDPSIFVVGFISAMIACFIASFFPAWQASKLTPLDIIRSNL